MTEPRIIYDSNDLVLSTPKKIPIKNGLVLSGGGISQTFFALGAVGCLVDNGLFNFDLISSVSGGSLLLWFIDLCTNPLYNYHKKRDWYNKYVRKNLYKLFEIKFFAFLVKKAKLDLDILEKYLSENFTDFNLQMTQPNTNIICEYYYINANTNEVLCDHSDMIDLKNDVKDNSWYIKQLFRCALPFTNFNDKPTYDVGNIQNLPITAVLNKYTYERVIFVKLYSNLIYDKYKPVTTISLYNNWFRNNMSSSDTEIDKLINDILVPNKKNIICSISNDLNKSKDKYHKGVFKNYDLEYNSLNRLYKPIITNNNNNFLKIMENEGYIQMYQQLRRTGEAKVFKIPNPDVYNNNIKANLDEWANENIAFEFLKDLFFV
jgi:hypothetical protein